ncbi:MAG: YjbQ family protein [candidate division Zixibacteria bacterium]|nr:YjbQ family protein [Candidatus Tariuqbacter arcticus]
MKEFTVRTKSRNETVNIDREVMAAIKESGVKNGTCTVFIPHTTAAVTINENADPAVQRDILTKLSSLIPQSEGYAHMEGNSDAHIKASLVGSSETLIISGGRPMLGTWQSVFFCEFDGPRTRRAWIEVKGE